MRAIAARRAQVPEVSGDHRRLTALLRARAHAMRYRQGSALRKLTALLPALFHASFAWGGLRGEPPGIEGARARTCWARWAKSVDLPPPMALQRGRRGVGALLAVTTGDALEVFVVPAARASRWEMARINQRVSAIKALALHHGWVMQLTVVAPSGWPEDAGAQARLLRYGALLAGQLPERFFVTQGGSDSTSGPRLATASSPAVRSATSSSEAAEGREHSVAAVYLGDEPDAILSAPPGRRASAGDLTPRSPGERRGSHPPHLAESAESSARLSTPPSKRTETSWSFSALASREPVSLPSAPEVGWSFDGLSPAQGAARVGSLDSSRSGHHGFVDADHPERSRASSLLGAINEPSSAEEGCPVDVAPAGSHAAQLWQTAPSELACAFSLLSVAPWPGGELSLLREAVALALNSGCSLWSLADPELLMAVIAAMYSKRPHLALRACALAAANPHTANGAERLTVRFEPPGCDTRSTLEVGRALAVELLRATRAVPAAQPSARHAAGPGFARALLPALARELEETLAPRGLRLSASAERGFEVTDTNGTRFGWGRSAEQAWVRAVSLVRQLPGRGQLAGIERGWRALSEALVETPTLRTLVLSIESQERPGPPYDVLNRGPNRELAFDQVVAVLLRPGKRPSARRLEARAAVALVLAESARGSAVKFASAGRAAQTVEARLTRLLAKRRPGSLPTVEVGGRIVQAGRSMVGQPHQWFARRPVRSTFDAEAPDLGFEVTQGREVRVGPHQVHCLAWLVDESLAQVMYVDDKNRVLREQVPLDQLEAHLQEARALMRERLVAPSVRVAPEVAKASLFRPRSLAPDVDIRLWGALPFGLRVEVGGEQFGAGCRWGWAAAASSALSRWPRTVLGRVRVTSVDVSVGGVQADAIMALYARSAGLRRLWAHIVRINRT